MVGREAFLDHLRSALTHLHDHERLRQNPLAALLGVDGRFDTAAALRTILKRAIAELKPSDSEPSSSHAWRVYDSLFCCYVQQLTQHVVADQLGLSARQLRREQQAAFEVLADHLWERYVCDRVPADETDGDPDPSSLSEGFAADELAWLRESPPGKTGDLSQQLQNVVETSNPLADENHVILEITSPAQLPDVSIHSVALSQILLSLISAAILRSAPGGHVELSAALRQWDVTLSCQSCQSGTDWPPASTADGNLPAQTSGDQEAEGSQAMLHMARELADLSGVPLAIHSTDGGAFTATLSLPAIEQRPVLVVDDNADTLQLLRRYMTGTRYGFIGTRDPERALALAEEHAPQAIVIDVMMPQTDGWHVLSSLRQHPKTAETPVIVCTILPQKPLALSLGADDFLRKPVTRQDFLAALDDQVVRHTPEAG